MTYVATITDKGQVTIPVAIRDIFESSAFEQINIFDRGRKNNCTTN